MILGRSPEFCLKPLIYRYQLIGDPLVGPFLSPEIYFEQIELWSTRWCYILNIRALDILVSNRMICFVFYIQMLTLWSQ